MEVGKGGKVEDDWLNLQHRRTTRLFPNWPSRAISTVGGILTVPFAPSPTTTLADLLYHQASLVTLGLPKTLPEPAKWEGIPITQWCLFPGISLLTLTIPLELIKILLKPMVLKVKVSENQSKTNCCWGFLCTQGKCPQEKTCRNNSLYCHYTK